MTTTAHRPTGAPQSPVPADRAARRTRLLDAAERAIRRVGAAASMNEIAAEAGITKPVLYQEFSSKAGLSNALGERYLTDLGTTLERLFAEAPDAAAAVRAGVGVFVKFAAREPELFRFLLDGGEAEIDDSPMTEWLVALIVRFLHGPTVGLDDVERARTWAIAVMAMLIGTVPWALTHQAARPHEMLADDLTALLVDGIARGGAMPTVRQGRVPGTMTG